MWTVKLILVFFIFNLCSKFASSQFGSHNIYNIKYVPLREGEDPGEPLILTPYIEQGKIEEAKNLSAVPGEPFFGIKSYSGYFTVKKQHNSNTFFWFIPATDVNYREVPVILWLQGGPGGSSMYGLLLENGPFKLINETHIELREAAWTSNHSVLYIDNPVGTGYSFTNNRWCSNEVEIGEDLYCALVQFFKLFPELQNNDFFVTGESYAGKYVPAISYTIHKKNAEADSKINLKGLAIGNGLSDPANQLNYADYLFQNGLIDFNRREAMKKLQNKVLGLIQEEKYKEAYTLYSILLDFKISTGFDYYFNYLESNATINDQYPVFLQQANIRRALHVGNMSYVTDDEVQDYLQADFVKSVAPWISELLSNYRVLTYNGQLDIIVAYPLTVNYLRHLNFSAADEYKSAKRHEWIVNGEIAGYVKSAGNLTEVLVRNSGHMVPQDQPEWALDLISKFVKNVSLY